MHTSAPAAAPVQQLSRHHAYLRTRLRGLGVADADLDDAVQDVFEVLVRRISDYDSRFSLRQWMAGVARKVAKRHRERRVALVIEEGRIAAPTPDPEHAAARGEGLVALQRFLAGLDADRWAVFVLSELEGLRGTEIAAELDVNLSTVYARLRSARAAFEAAVAAQRGPGRPWLAALFAAPSALFRRAGSGAFVTPIVLGALTVISIGGVLGTRACSDTPTADEEPVAAAPSVTPAQRAGISGRDVDAARLRDVAASDARPLPDADGWVVGGSGSSVGQGVWSHRIHYRLETDVLVVRIAASNDGDVPTQGHGWIDLDGFELVDGPAEWSDDLAVDEQRTRTWRLRATRTGVVRATFNGGLDREQRTGASLFRFVHAGGRLRWCEPDECRITTESIADGMVDEPISVELHNDCDRDIELALLPAGVEVPPPDAPRFRLTAGEHRVVTVDSLLVFARRGEDGRYGGTIGSDTPGAIVRFFGEGCSSRSADSPPAR